MDKPSNKKTIAGRLAYCIKQAIPAGMKTSWWLITLTLPVSFIVLLMDHFGVLVYIAQYTSPLFQTIGLPGVASIVLVTSILTNIYAVIAVLSTLALPVRDGTILAVMCLISHAFLIETAILKKTGSSATRMVILRLTASFIVGAVLNALLPGQATEANYTLQEINTSFNAKFLEWLPQIGTTLLKIVVLVNALLILQRSLEEFGILRYITKPLTPFIKLLGLPKDSAFLWIVGNTLGLSYGSAIMLENSKKGDLKPKECDLLNHHLAISHSQLEDPLLFLSLGYALPILIIPRIVLAIISVWLRRFEIYLREKSSKNTYINSNNT